MQISASSFSSSTKGALSSAPNPLENKDTLKIAYSTPQILMRLGKKLEQTEESSISAPQISEVKNFADSLLALGSLLERSNALIAKAYRDQHFSSGAEVNVLKGQLKEMEFHIQKLQSEGAIDNREIATLTPTVDDFYELFTSLEHWLTFQQRYFNIDEQIDLALCATSPSIFSDLHGVSPSAFTGATEGIEKMALLISLSSPLLQQQGTFAPDLEQQLAGDVTSTCWSCSEWIHDLDMHFSEVVDVAEGLWKNALTTEGEFKRFEKMQEAAELLLSSRELLQGMAKSLPIIKERISDSKRELAKLKESDQRQEMERQLSKLEEAFNGFSTKLPKLLQSLEASINEKKVRTNLAIARKRAERVLAEVDIDYAFKESVQGYKADSTDSYLSLKRNLRPLLILNNDSVKQIKEFFHSEEERLSAIAGYRIDFDELLRIQVAKEGQAAPGLVSRLFSALDPSQWSENTVQCWRVGLAALQLSANVLETYQKIQQAPVKIVPSLTEQQQKKLDKETARLGVLLSDKYQVIKDPKMLETLTEKMPEMRSTLKAILENNANAPTAAELRHILQSYRTERQQSLLQGRSSSDTGQTVVKSATQTKKTEDAAAMPIKDGILLPAAAQKVEAIQSLQEASTSLANSQRQLLECRAIDYLFPALETSPQSLQRLKGEIKLLQKSLKETMNSLLETQSPVPSLVDWNQGVIEQCHAVKDLENRIAEAMLAYQESMAISLKPADSKLDAFGNKHKNIVKQADLVDALGLEGIVVPRPRGISSEQVLQFLNTVAPEIFEHWNDLGNLHTSYKGEGPFLDNADAAAHLKAIQEGIDLAFTKAASDDKAFTSLGLSKEMKEWLLEMQSRGNFLMVRSTGAEDSLKHANAGGNDSVAYVEPTTEALCDALGKVVRSYFGYSSLQNRLNAKLNPFKENLKMAVTAQELIGEPIGGASDPSQIPISLVLFSNEPLYIGKEEFRAMRISATYGHGEGVVGNKGISGDSALILQSRSHPDQLYILYDNQLKPTRLAPVRDKEGRKNVLEKLSNTPEMANRPVLNADFLQRLYEWGVIGEKFFDNFPTDMEIVIKGGKIFPVQARPVNRPSMLPTYLDLRKVGGAETSPIEKTLLAEMLVPGMASVVKIARPEEILMAETLAEAESFYRPGQHKLVVVSQPEPALSHPVINFSNLGVPCLYAKEFSNVQDLAQRVDEKHQLAVCMQSAAIYLWDGQKGSIEEFQSQGFVVHPAKVALSLPIEKTVPEKIGTSEETPQEIRELLYQLRTTTTSQSASQQLKTLRDHTWIKTFQNRLNDLEAKVSGDRKLQKLTAPAIKAARALNEKLDRSFSEVQAILKDSSFKGRLELLLHVKVLETLLFQKPSSENALAQHSVLGFTRSFEAADALIDYQKQLPHAAHFGDLLLDGSECPIDDVFDIWKNFLIKLEPIAHRTLKGEAAGLSIAEIARFKVVLGTLRQAGVLPLFTTFFFGSLQKEPIQMLKAINNMIPVSEEPLIERLAIHKQSIRQLKDDLGKFAEPKAFTEVWERLQKITVQFCSYRQPWLQRSQWNSASPVTRSIALQTMNELVELYDSAIKSMKASPQFKDDIKKTQKFKEMLGPYFTLLDGWAAETVGRGGFETHASWPLSSYLMKIEEIFRDLPNNDPLQLRPSQFSVSAAVLGSRTAFERHLPQHLEDIFTLIHQNLMASTSVLTKELFSERMVASSPLPENLKLALARAPSIGGAGVGQPQLIGIDIDSTGVIFRYNVPLRNHSGKFSIRYDRQKKQVSMETLFLGQARERWNQGSERAIFLDAGEVIRLISKPKITPHDLTYSCDITEEKNLEAALEEYRYMGVLSLGRVSMQESQRDLMQKLGNARNLEKAARFVLKEKIRSEFALSLLKNYIDQIDDERDFTEIALPFALELSEDFHESVRRLALELIEKIVNRGHCFKEAITLATKMLLDTDLYVQKEALNLFGKIIIHNPDIDESIQIVSKLSKDGDWRARKNALLLLEKIINRGQGIDEAIVIVNELSKDGVSDVQADALKLFSKIVAQGQGINEALALAIELSKNGDLSTSPSSILLLVQIIEQGQGFNEAIVIATELSKNANAVIQFLALQLFAKIVMKDQGISETITAAGDFSRYPDWIAKAVAQPLLMDIIDRLHHLSKHADSNLRKYALEMLGEIIEKGHGFNEAIAIAAELSRDVDSLVRLNALELFAKIIENVKQGHGVNEVIVAIKEWNHESSSDPNDLYLKLREALIERQRDLSPREA